MQYSVQDAGINNHQVTEKTTSPKANINIQTKSTNNRTYATSIGCGIGAAIAYLVGVATLTPAIVAVAVFVVAAVAGRVCVKVLWKS